MDLQDVSNLTIPEGEVKTIHDSSSYLLWGSIGYDTKYSGDTIQNDTPTPDSPSAINVVTGSQSIKVHGDNICKNTIFNNLDNWTTNYQANYWTPKGNSTLEIAPPSNTTGYFTKIYQQLPTVSSHKYYVCATITQTGTVNSSLLFLTNNVSANYPTPRIVLSSNYSNSKMSDILQPSADNAYIGFMIQKSASNTNPPVMTVKNLFCVDLTEKYGSGNEPSKEWCDENLQYELHQSNSYTVNLGSTELCKIGAHKDYIYKSGDDWYVHKETSKVILNGLESWGGSNSKYNYSSADVIVQPLTQDAPIVAMSAYLTASNYWAISNNLADNIIAGYYNGGQIRVRVTSFATVTDWKTWLSNHNMAVYYVLATPTDTQITDVTLISQLDAIHQWLTRYGYNVTVSGNLPIIIDRTTL